MKPSPIGVVFRPEAPLALAFLVSLALAGGVAFAQQPGPPPGAGGPPPGVVPGGPPAGAVAPEAPAASSEGGLYVNPFWLALVIVSIILWLYAAAWITDDGKGIGLDYARWSGIMLAAGGFGLLLTILIHAAVAFFMLICVGAVYVLYVMTRNQQVPERFKLFGPHHRAALLSRLPGVKEVSVRLPRTRAAATVPLTGSSGATLDGLVEETPALEEGGAVLGEMLLRAGATRTRKARLQPAGEQYVMQFVLDGVLHNVEGIEPELGQQTLAVAAALAGLAEGGRMKRGSGSISTELPGYGQIEVGVQVGAAGGKPSLVLEMPDWTRDLYKEGLAALGMHDSIIKRVKAAVDQGRGTLLLCGPARSGKTTTWLGAVDQVDIFTTDVVLLEQGDKHELESVRGWEVPTERPFEEFYAEILREGPDVFMLDDVHTQEQAVGLLSFGAEEGLAIGVVEAPDAPDGLVRLRSLAGDGDLAARAASCALTQRLVRKLCTTCREEVEPNPALLQKLGIDPEDPGVWYRPVGCEDCLQSGYLGQTAIFGMLILTDPVKEALAGERPTPNAIRTAAGKAAFRTMNQDGIAKVTAGITTLEEIRRVLKG